MIKNHIKKISFLLATLFMIVSYAGVAYASEITGHLSSGYGNTQNAAANPNTYITQFAVVNKNQSPTFWELPNIVKAILITFLILEIVTLLIINLIKKRKKIS